MNWHSLPPLTSLRAFSAFAEAGNVTEAGAMLNVSHAAISQQLKALEAHLGVALLDRRGRDLVMTAEGAHLARALTLGFGAIHDAVEELSQQSIHRPLHISCTPAFAMHWLMPRLADFRERHEDIDLVIDATAKMVELKPGGADIALRYGDGHWPGLKSEMLLQSSMSVVAAPGLIGARKVDHPEELLSLPWLEELGTTEANHWLKKRGVQDLPSRHRLELPGNLLGQALLDGQGVAVGVRHFLEPHIRAGHLIELFREEDTLGYHIVTRGDVLRPPLKAFVAWLRRQAK